MVQLLSQWYHTLLSQSYHRGCHGRSVGIVTPVPWSWKDRVLLGGTSVSTPFVTTVPKIIINPPNNLFEHETQQNIISQNRQATAKEGFDRHSIQTDG